MDTPSQPVRTISLDCLPGGDVRAALRTDGGLAEIRAACTDEIRTATDGWNIGAAGQDAVLAALLAYRFAPYGESRAITYEALLNERVLDCDNYMLLAGYILDQMRPGAEIIYVGFDGGPIGNHAQAFFTGGDAAVFLDPTVGVIAQTDFDSLMTGQPLSATRVLRDARAPEAAVAQLQSRVLSNIQSGGYRPSHLLYYFVSRSDLLLFSEHTGPLWNGGAAELAYHFPTPGGAVLGARLKAAQSSESNPSKADDPSKKNPK